MKICAIIAEYNPFHNGHKYMIDQVRAEGGTHIVAVMSGSFVQRGDVAVCDKYSRTEMALKNGVDLVIELPVTFAAATAQKFAHGAVSLINSLGCVDTLAFGSECGSIKRIKKIADAINDEQVIKYMRENLDSGISFAVARQMALDRCGHEGELLQSPNDTLAVCYLDEIAHLGAELGTMAIHRIGTEHDCDEPGDGFASASAIRRLLTEGRDTSRFVTESVTEILEKQIQSGACPMLFERLDTAVMARLRSMSAEDIARLPDVSEGLENRIYKAARECGTAADVADAVKSKRYTHARIRRILLSSLTGVDRDIALLEPQYIRILGINERGREILSLAKPALPVIARAKDAAALTGDALRMFKAQTTADGIAALAAGVPMPCPDEIGVVIQ